MNDYSFGERSISHLSKIINPLHTAASIALGYGIMDFAVIESVRLKEEQNRLYLLGKSKVQWPDGAHNVLKAGEKARAFDAAPWVNGDISWRKEHCLVLAGIILAAGRAIDYDIRWGGNWDMDGEPITDQDFQDLVHYEIRRTI